MGLLIKYRQVAEEIKDLEPGEPQNLVLNQELVLRSSLGSMHRSGSGR